MAKYNIMFTLMFAVAWHRPIAHGEQQTEVSSPATQFNSTTSTIEDQSNINSSTDSRVSSILTHLPTLKIGVILICVLTAVLVTCLVMKVIRSGRRLRKTRKYDIITTPAERVEMAPLNDDNEDEDDSTLFDVKYR